MWEYEFVNAKKVGKDMHHSRDPEPAALDCVFDAVSIQLYSFLLSRVFVSYAGGGGDV